MIGWFVMLIIVFMGDSLDWLMHGVDTCLIGDSLDWLIRDVDNCLIGDSLGWFDS